MANSHNTGIDILFHSGGFKLKGTLHLPSKVNMPPIVFGSHGLLANSDSPKQLALARQCTAAGIAFFRFDHRGCGKSQGSSMEINSLSGRCEDLAAAINTIFKRKVTRECFGLFGSSMGGAVCINSSGTLKPKAMVTYAAPIRSRNINEVIEKEFEKEPQRGPLYNPKNLKFDIAEKISGLSSILVIHGDADETVPVSHAHQIFEASREPKKILIQKGGDHPMSDRGHQTAFIQESVAWFKRFLL